MKTRKQAPACKPKRPIKRATAVKPHKSLIGIIAKGEIAKGHSDEEVLATVWANVPDSETTIECIQWYRSKMRSRGLPVPTSKEAAAMVLDRRCNAAPSAPLPRKLKRQRPSPRRSGGYAAKRTA